MSNTIKEGLSNFRDEVKDTNAYLHSEAYVLRALGSLINVHVNNFDELEDASVHVNNDGNIGVLSTHGSHADTGVILWHVIPNIKAKFSKLVIVAGTSLFPDFYDDILSDQDKIRYEKQIEIHKKNAIKKAHEGRVIMKLAEHHNYSVIKVHQLKDIQKDRRFALLQLRINEDKHNDINNVLQENRVAVIYFPQGTREETEDLCPTGVNKLIEYDSNQDGHVLFLPIGLVGAEKVLTLREGIKNLRGRIDVNIGKAFYPDDLLSEYKLYKDEHKDSILGLQDLVMSRMLSLVPHSKWRGYKQHPEFIEYYKKKFPQSRVLFDAKEAADRG